MVFVFSSAAAALSTLHPLHAAAYLLRHRLELGFGVGQTSRSVNGQNEERKSLREKGANFGKIYFLTDLSLVSRQLPALLS